MSGWIYVPPDVTALDGSGLATDAELAAHAASTAPIHGIDDTADIITVNNLIASLPIADDDTAGIITLATIVEMDAGQETGKAPNVRVIAKSIYGQEIAAYEVFGGATAWSTGDGKLYVPIPPKLNGWDLIDADATCLTKSTSGTPTVQVARGRRANATADFSFVDMLSTVITIDVNEFDSLSAATQPVINASNNDVATGDLIRIDIDVAGAGTTGGWVRLTFQVP